MRCVGVGNDDCDDGVNTDPDTHTHITDRPLFRSGCASLSHKHLCVHARHMCSAMQCTSDGEFSDSAAATAALASPHTRFHTAQSDARRAR